MKWLEMKVCFESLDQEIATDLIAEIFYMLGVQGVKIEDQDVRIQKDRANNDLIQPKYDAVIGYLPITEGLSAKREVLNESLRHLKKKIGMRYRVFYNEMDEQDWAESWKNHFWPVRVSPLMVVKPTWREYKPSPQEIVLEIDPGMAFGTGTHATTRLCIRMIEKYLKKDESFLDIGTGSGILLIAAAKLGAGKGLGIDIDEVAVDIARKNLSLNYINPEMFHVRRGDLTDQIEIQYDLAVANIVSDIIITLLPGIKRVIKENGVFICSGIICENQSAVIENMDSEGFKIIEVFSEEEWVSIAGRLEGCGF